MLVESTSGAVEQLNFREGGCEATLRRTKRKRGYLGKLLKSR
jgi:hypothetical protein